MGRSRDVEWWRQWEAWGVIATVIGIVVGVALYKTSEQPRDIETSISIVTPTASAKPTSTAMCADRSLTSLRQKTHVCVDEIGLIWDPCFDTEDGQVACPLERRTEHLTVTEVVPISEEALPIEGPLSLEDAIATTYPWAIRTADGTWCQLWFWGGEEEIGEEHAYLCKRVAIDFVTDAKAFFQDPKALRVHFEGDTSMVTAVERPSGDGPWVGVFHEGGSSTGHMVEIAEVFF